MIVVSLAASSFASASTAQQVNDAYSGLPMTYTRDEKGMVIPRCPIHGLCGNPWATENGFNQ